MALYCAVAAIRACGTQGLVEARGPVEMDAVDPRAELVPFCVIPWCQAWCSAYPRGVARAKVCRLGPCFGEMLAMLGICRSGTGRLAESMVV